MSDPDKQNRSWGHIGDQAETRDRRTIAYEPTLLLELDLGPPRRPSNQYQALMEAEPHTEPVEDQQQFDRRVRPLRDAIEDPDVLTARERWIIEARFYRRLSVREVAELLPWSVTHVHRIEHCARQKLKEHLQSLGEYT